jgi:hypothetical protein
VYSFVTYEKFQNTGIKVYTKEDEKEENEKDNIKFTWHPAAMHQDIACTNFNLGLN